MRTQATPGALPRICRLRRGHEPWTDTLHHICDDCVWDHDHQTGPALARGAAAALARYAWHSGASSSTDAPPEQQRVPAAGAAAELSQGPRRDHPRPKFFGWTPLPGGGGRLATAEEIQPPPTSYAKVRPPGPAQQQEQQQPPPPGWGEFDWAPQAKHTSAQPLSLAAAAPAQQQQPPPPPQQHTQLPQYIPPPPNPPPPTHVPTVPQPGQHIDNIPLSQAFLVVHFPRIQDLWPYNELVGAPLPVPPPQQQVQVHRVWPKAPTPVHLRRPPLQLHSARQPKPPPARCNLLDDGSDRSAAAAAEPAESTPASSISLGENEEQEETEEQQHTEEGGAEGSGQ